MTAANPARFSFDDVLTALQDAGAKSRLLRFVADHLNGRLELGPFSWSWIAQQLRDYADLLDRQSAAKPSTVRRVWDNTIGDFRDIEN